MIIDFLNILSSQNTFNTEYDSIYLFIYLNGLSHGLLTLSGGILAFSLSHFD